ncbi:MAG: hypothetical protein Q9N67_07375 [Ghiorsea sp.]|nr:hypothetical protein [Ghiorsea sp.]
MPLMESNIRYYILAGAALLGLFINMSFSWLLVMPDWSLSILLAMLLSQRSTWYWVLPLIGLHDYLLFCSVWVVFPFAVLSALLLMYADVSLAPGQYQRWASLLLACAPLLFADVGWLPWLLTVTLTVWIWSYLSVKREKVYVEPT